MVGGVATRGRWTAAGAAERSHRGYKEIIGSFPARDGARLHTTVSPSRWCITRKDLQQFRKVVECAVGCGQLLPSPADEFDPLEHEFGPSIYTVTNQIVAPITFDKGSPSWALMLHPEGLECELFVTHCWAEGTYECVDKVLHTWPRGVRHAYICMLSMPQNLDIGGFLSSPSTSPFAQALRSASYTLVVPNSTCSIYTRIWCVYEAYLSYAWHKPIFTARRPHPGLVVAVGGAAASFIAGASVAWLVFNFWVRLAVDMNWIALAIIGTCGFGTMLMRPSYQACIVNLLGSFMSGIMTMYCWEAWLLHFANPLFKVIAARASAFMYFMTGAFFAAREADRSWDRGAAHEAEQLRRGYTGRLEDARSSVEADRQRILEEIVDTNQVDKVEEAISVLIRAGMSTPSLRLAATKGIDISGAGHWSIAMVHGVCIVFVWHPLPHIIFNQSCSGYFRWVPVVKLLEGLLWAALFSRLQADQRGIAACSGIFFGALPYFTFWAIWVFVAQVDGTIGQHTNCVPDVLGVFLWGPLILLMSWLGVDLCMACPRLGPMLVRLFLRSSSGLVGGQGQERLPGKAVHCAGPVAGTNIESSDSSDSYEA